MNKNLYTKIVSDLKKHANKEGAEIAKRYHKYEGYKCYGIEVALVRKILKGYKKDILGLSCADVLALAQKFYIPRIEEQVMAGNYILQTKIDCLTPSKFGYLCVFNV